MIDKGHIITMDDSTISAKFQPIVRRLQKAAMDKEMLQQMELEDEFIAEMDMYYDDLENAVRMKEDALRMKEEERRMKEEERRMKEDALRMKEDALELKGEAIKKQHKAVQLMVERGIDKLFISNNLGLSVEEIEEIVKSEF
jgi:N12 class adenine-specific DNA methylase